MNYGEFLGKVISYKGTKYFVWAIDVKDYPNVTLLSDDPERRLVTLNWEEYKNIIDTLENEKE